MNPRALAVASLAALPATLIADVSLVDPATLATTHVDDFNDLGLGQTNYDNALVRDGLSLAERFVGQSQEANYVWDEITGIPTAPLTLQAGDPGENLTVFDAPEPWLVTVVAGNGPEGYPDFDAIGEGAVAILFEEDQFELGLELEGVEFGCVTFAFYRRDGSHIDTDLVCGAESKPYAFRRSGNIADIAGVVITNTDDSGLAIDNIRFSMNPCEADVNGDGAVNILDFVAFQAAFVAGDMSADCTGDGSLDVLDFVCFQALVAMGCE